MMNKIITASQYYIGLAYFIVACQAQAEVRKFAEKLDKLLQDDYVIDDIYNPEMTGTKEEFDSALQRRGIDIDWLAVEKRTKKKEEKEMQDEQTKS